MNVGLTFRAKGLGGIATRAETILSRFGIAEDKARAALDEYVAITERAGARPTLPITAVVLSRHPRLVTEYAERGVEFAIHGLVHGDHAKADLDTQTTSIAEAADRFAEAGVPFCGFRGPYLRRSADTGTVLAQLGFLYDSTQAVEFPVLDPSLRGTDSYRRMLETYKPVPSGDQIVRPRLRGSLIDLPVAVPDDEVFVERLGLSSDAQSAAWRAILRRTNEEEELFTLMLHPERIFECGRALAEVLSEARTLRTVWVARLDEIARWWLRRSEAGIHLRKLADDRFSVTLVGEPDVTLSLHRPPHGAERIASGTTVEFFAPFRPAVGVPPTAPETLVEFLREEGYIVERSLARAEYAAYIAPADGAWSERDALAAVASATSPVARVSRWPLGASSALAITGDIDSLTVQDFLLRLWETS
jgi:peptidoglycan/xylan/chitin deacetylase (PgdA/CDA1 family)